MGSPIVRKRWRAVGVAGERSSVTPRGRAAVLLGVIAAALVTFGGAAFAHFDTGLYTHSNCPADNNDRVDPINIVFWDWGTSDRVVSQIQSHASWLNGSGSSQTFIDHGACFEMGAQRASSGTASTRFHVRLHPIHLDDSLRWTTVGDAHHEDFVWYCGHAVDSNGSSGSGFDQGRRQLRILFESAGHSWSSRFWGNTQNFQQCDGDYASSDGYTVFIRLHQQNH
jgi:hypothetical protein